VKEIFKYFSKYELKALKITTIFETSKPLNFGGLAGNFDGCGISFGLLQWNIKSGSLQPLLKDFIRLSPAGFDKIFGDDSKSFKEVIMNKSPKEQLQFAISINDSKNRIIEPWKTYFRQFGDDSQMQAIQIKHTRTRMNIAAKYVTKFGFKSERALALMFDIVTQHGPKWLKVKNRESLINSKFLEKEKTEGKSLSEISKMAIVAEILTATSKSAFVQNALKRKLILINGRGNLGKRKFDLDKDFGLSNEAIS
jgi:hypothetical protein